MVLKLHIWKPDSAIAKVGMGYAVRPCWRCAVCHWITFATIPRKDGCVGPPSYPKKEKP